MRALDNIMLVRIRDILVCIHLFLKKYQKPIHVLDLRS